MKKTIAALLVTILASAGYVVLDKSAAEKIDVMASQISAQQSVIASFQEDERTPAEMTEGDTMRCYPVEHATIQAYYLDFTNAPKTTKAFRMTEVPSGTAAPTTTPSETTRAATTHAVRAAADEEPTPTAPILTNPTGATITAPPDNTANTTFPTTQLYSTTTPTATTRPATATTKSIEPTIDWTDVPIDPTYPTILPEPTIPGYIDYDHYTSLVSVQIDRFTCTMTGKAPSAIPEFRIVLRAQTDPQYAGKSIRAEVGESGNTIAYLWGVVADDGSITLSETVRLMNAKIIALEGLFIW